MRVFKTKGFLCYKTNYTKERNNTKNVIQEMAGIVCTHVAMGWIGGVLYSRVAQTHSSFRGSESRLIYVGRGPAFVVWSGIPSWV